MSKYFFNENVQNTAKKMLDKHFPNKHKILMKDVWYVFLDGKYKMCAVDPEGKYLYIVGKKEKRIKRPKKIKNNLYKGPLKEIDI